MSAIGPESLLIGAVAGVGVLHTIVPDHWVPITLIARERSWSKAETARASFQAGVGHVLSTLVIALIVWLAGVAVAARFGHIVDTAASVALVIFGVWIAVAAWRDLRGSGHHHGDSHGHSHAHALQNLGGGIHGPELQRIQTDHGELLLSIYEAGVPPHFRLTGVHADAVTVEILREDGRRQQFACLNRGPFWESVHEIPEPHGFEVMVSLEHGGHVYRFETQFAEREFDPHHHHHHHEEVPEDDPLYAPLRGDTAVLTRHLHIHRHGRGRPHVHWHDHLPQTAHTIVGEIEAKPPLHEHRHKTTARMALLLILGSSPMVEGIPAFFAASQFGLGLILVMSVVFALSTIATYMLLCVYSTAGLQRVRLGPLERYGEILSGAFIAAVGVAFWIWPVL
jgi:hypothetical protein